MEGVVVSAHKDASAITVSVASDKQGHFSFPANRLEPGHCTLAIRAVGYDLDGSAAADVSAHSAATVDLKLVKTKNLASQLTSAEWLMSMPGTDQQKDALLNCVNCHTLQRPLSSTHAADEFAQVIFRMMGYASGSQPIRPQRRVNADEVAGSPEKYRTLASYLASVNRSATSTWEYPLKTLPRPIGSYQHNNLLPEIRNLRRNARAPHIFLLTEELDDAKLASLYRGCNALALPYRGEGFGMPLVEAMACGTPVVTTKAGPAPEFCPAGASYLIPAKETPVADPPPPFGAFSREWTWFEPDLVELGNALREIYENRGEATHRGALAGQLILQTHAWPRIMPLYLDRITRLTAQMPEVEVAGAGSSLTKI